jgi:hypothetical protein
MQILAKKIQKVVFCPHLITKILATALLVEIVCEGCSVLLFLLVHGLHSAFAFCVFEPSGIARAGIKQSSLPVAQMSEYIAKMDHK